MVAGQSVYIVSQFCILIALARLGTVANVGQFGLATAIVTPIYWLTDLGLRTNKNTDADDTLTFANLFALRLITSLAGFAMILLAAVFYADDATTRAILVIYGAAKGVETLSDIAYGVLERHGQMRLFAQSIIARGLGSLVIFTLILWRTGSVSGAFVGQLVVWTLVYLLHDIRHARRLSAAEPQGIAWASIWHAAKDSRHLGMGRFLSALANAVPRFIIEHFVGLVGLGLFTAIAYVLQASLMLMTAVSRSITGHLADLAVRGHGSGINRIIARYSAATAAAGLFGTAAGWFAGDPVVTLVFGPEFAGQEVLVVLILLTATLRSVGLMLLSGPLARRSFKAIVWVRLADLAGITAGSLFGAWAAGLNGAAAGLVAASAVQLVLILLVFFGPARLRIG
jgi:O-antigen/teichoic acid export membrane protein